MSDSTPLPDKLSDDDLSQLTQTKQKKEQTLVQMASIQMILKHIQTRQGKVDADGAALAERLKQDYQLAPGDSINDDGTITRKGS